MMDPEPSADTQGSTSNDNSIMQASTEATSGIMSGVGGVGGGGGGGGGGSEASNGVPVERSAVATGLAEGESGLDGKASSGCVRVSASYWALGSGVSHLIRCRLVWMTFD